MAAVQWLKGRTITHNRARSSPNQGRKEPQKIPWGTDQTKNWSKESEGLQQFLWALCTVLHLLAEKQTKWKPHHCLPWSRLACSISKRSSTYSLLCSLHMGNCKGSKKAMTFLQKAELPRCWSLRTAPTSATRVKHLAFSGCDTGHRKRAGWGCSPGPALLLRLSERIAEMRGEGVGGMDPWKDWCKFTFKSQTDENNFHSPTAVLRILFGPSLSKTRCR